jgi:hypothetical protein
MLRFVTPLMLGLGILAAAPLWAAEKDAKTEANGLPLVFADDFENGADHWRPTDPRAWRIAEVGRGKVYNQFQTSKYNPPFRSPLNISLVKDVVVGDFVLTAKVQSTTRDYPHRDMCLFFGYQDPAHFYYVHLGKRADPNAHQIMIVNKAPRVKITKKESPGAPWDDNWHDVKLVRRVAEGTIEVYFDDMKTPALAAQDKTFPWGQVGLGSFDDTGNWDDFKLYGMKVARPAVKK